jgi:hypothetical protein
MGRFIKLAGVALVVCGLAASLASRLPTQMAGQ